MSSSPISLERARLQGAIEVLDTLREDLALRRDEAQSEAAREAYDEVLTVVEALEHTFHQRQQALPPLGAQHASYVFLLDAQGRVHPLPHTLYVALVRGLATAPQFACQQLRLAEWYVRLSKGEPETVVNEHYGMLAFDSEGRIDWEKSLPETHDALPSREERENLYAALFGAPTPP
jgi:hypothetical protein